MSGMTQLMLMQNLAKQSLLMYNPFLFWWLL
jgi:hypothetical protein